MMLKMKSLLQFVHKEPPTQTTLQSSFLEHHLSEDVVVVTSHEQQS